MVKDAGISDMKGSVCITLVIRHKPYMGIQLAGISLIVVRRK
jgi:hypothetical protein